MKENKGITLIALVITIIVLLLLAGISISMLAGNNSILNRAGESRVANALGTGKDAVNMAVMAAAQDYYQSIYDGQNVSTTYTASGLDEYIVENVKANNSNSEYNLSVADVNFDSWNGTGTGASITLVYTPDSSQVTGTLNNGVITWGGINSAGQQTTVRGMVASEIAAAPTTYYGMDVVGYTTNSRVKAKADSSEADDAVAGKTIEWQVFYADANNIYLISKDYVEREYLPLKNGVRPLAGDSSYPRAAKFGSSTSNGVMVKYGGNENIDSSMYSLNSAWFNYTTDNGVTYPNRTSRNNDYNMQAVAYMLDSTIWNNVYGNSSLSSYVIGGPTVELLFKAYNQYANGGNNTYQARVTGTTGYQISKNSGGAWANFYGDMINTSSSYCISSQTKALAYWLASPSANGTSEMMNVDCNCYVHRDWYTYGSSGFRPLVCLNSNITLEEATVGGKTVLQIVQ